MRSSKEMMPSTTVAADEWSDLAVGTLLECYNDKYIELNGGSIGTKGWQDVIFKLNSVCADGKPVYSYRRCKNKLDVMKRRFKIERDRKANNGGVSDWPWFQKMEEIVSRNPRLGGTLVGIVGNGERQQTAEKIRSEPVRFDELNDMAVLAGETTPVAAAAALALSLKRERLGHASTTEEMSAGQLLSDQQEDAHTDSQARNSPAKAATKKRRKSGCLHNPLRHAKEVARIVTDALERMEMKRLEVMRELELKRNETQLQIARMIIESNNRHIRQAAAAAAGAAEPHYMDCHAQQQLK